ncbi:MAG TPA: RNA 2',3'-cyclic phosphodiesterase [Candidatus Limnocylindrales bacterium]|nr:RNA 2',3'-cyclic phosphodiesterase [Candidatus Limnocylindrales bacterium]
MARGPRGSRPGGDQRFERPARATGHRAHRRRAGVVISIGAAPTTDRWRLFVAAPLPEDAAAAAWQALAEVRQRHPEARWLAPEKLHLTLVFLGQTDAREVERIAAAIASVAANHERYPIATGEGGGRISDRRGGVAWLRLTDGARETAAIALELDQALATATYDAGRPPHPHLTLARGVDQAALDDLRSAAREFRLAWTADRLVLFRSHTDPHGSRYEELASTRLSGG